VTINLKEFLLSLEQNSLRKNRSETIKKSILFEHEVNTILLHASLWILSGMNMFLEILLTALDFFAYFLHQGRKYGRMSNEQQETLNCKL
jgi:hypothetical protein